MKYAGMPLGMWMLFSGSFRKGLTTALGYDREAARRVTAKAKPRYRQIIASLPEFEKGDRFKMNIVSCAMLSAFLLNLNPRPTVDAATAYYREAMSTSTMKWFCKMSGRRKFTPSDIAAMRRAAALRAGDRNPYSWNMEFYPYPDGGGYEARFTACGICALMKRLGLFELVPAMCRLDYTMSELGGASEFTRSFTLASGGPSCDCGYRKKGA